MSKSMRKGQKVSLNIKLRKLAFIVFAWTAAGALIALYNHFLWLANESMGTAEDYSLGFHVITNMIIGFMGSLPAGFFLVFVVDERYRDQPYGRTILAVSIAFVTIVSLMTVIISGFVAIVQGGGIRAEETRLIFLDYVINTIHLSNTMFWAAVLIVTVFVLQMNDKFGSGLLWDFIRGYYHVPREEERVFMFLDLKSSTTIAEKLQNKRYYQLLRDLFSDITNPILNNKGEIYQYVGDEVVISWPLKNGLRHNNCLNCFFDIRTRLSERDDYYQTEYGVKPEFKAGLHYGLVTAGEIGVIKRDITYSGDVLNTAARIQSKCNQFEVSLLSSESLLDLLDTEGLNHRRLGEIQLRGKSELVGLSTLN